MAKKKFAWKFSFSIFWPFLAKIWLFLAKNALFGPFLPNATLNFPDFCHRNLFFGLLKNGVKKIRAEILKFSLFVQFLTKIFLSFFDQKSCFWPFSPKRYYICSWFLAYKLIFGLAEHSENWFFSPFLTKIYQFWPKIAQNLKISISFYFTFYMEYI